MIVEQQSGIYTAYETLIDAALDNGCQAYFASPSPLHALLINEGAKRFPERHGSFVQAAHPLEALSMSLGASQSGSLPLVSGNFSDFLAMQEVLQAVCQQECPMVISVLLYQQPLWPEASPISYAYPCFLAEWPACGLPLVNLMPCNLSQIHNLTREACWLALYLRQPVIILLDPALFTVTGAVLPSVLPQPNLPEPTGLHWLERVQKRQQALQSHKNRWRQCWDCVEEPEYYLLATGALGGWILDCEWPDGGVLVPEALFPFALQDLPAKPIYIVEFEPGSLYFRLQHLFPQRELHSLCLSWTRHFPIGLQDQIQTQLEILHSASDK